jgi:hypothetical protein
MPNQPKTPIRTIRIDDDLWEAFGAATADRSAALRDFIRWYTRQPGTRLPRRPDIIRSADTDQEA